MFQFIFQRKWVKKFSAIVFVVVLPSLLLFFCFRQFDFHHFWTEIQHAEWGWLLMAFLIPLLIPYLFAIQWRLFISDIRVVSVTCLFEIVSIWLMTINIVPFFGGHATAFFLLNKKGKISKIESLSVLTLDQISEGFSRLAVFAVVGLSVALPFWIKKGVQGVVFLVLIFYIILLVFAFHYRKLKKVELDETKGIMNKWMYHFSQWAHSLHVLRSLRKTLLAFLISLGIKGVDVLAILLVQHAFALSLPLWTPFLLIAALSLTTMLPIAPGQLGIFEATVFFVYQYLGIEGNLALILAVFHHIVHVIPFIILGYFSSLKLGLKNQLLFHKQIQPVLSTDVPL